MRGGHEDGEGGRNWHRRLFAKNDFGIDVNMMIIGKSNTPVIHTLKHIFS
jgi:hypothetical protein